MKKVVYALLLLPFIWSCRDLQERDIRNIDIELISPADNMKSVVLNQTFYWSKVDGANSYRIQIATPSFSPDVMSLVLDSITTKTEFTKSLPYTSTEKIQQFQWRVMAINSGYDSKFSTPRTFYLDSSGAITLQTVGVIEPTKDKYVNAFDVKFNWTELPQALSYQLDIDTSGKSMHIEKGIKKLDFTYKFAKEMHYTYSIRGADSKGNLSLNNPRELYIDKTNPVVTLSAPADRINNSKSQTVELKWTSNDLPFSKIKTHYVYVYEDSAEIMTVYRAYNGKQNDGFTENLVLPNRTDTLWWQIEAEDMAGNKSEKKRDYRRIYIRQ